MTENAMDFFPLGLEDQMPDFDIEVYHPETDEMLTEKISDYRGKHLVLFFYPADFTFVCPTELKDLYAAYPEMQKEDAEVLVVSVDTVFSHKRWVETEMLLKDFGIKMVADRTGELSDHFGILNAESGNSERATYIINPEGVIKSVEVVTEPIGRSAQELLRKVRALNFVKNNPGHACPASWNNQMKTLQPSIKIAGKVGEELEK